MLSVVIQAGGQSTRMGENKALKPFLGRPLIQRVIERLAPIADELLVTTNEPAALSFLNIPRFADLKPGRGALGGLYTALAVARHPHVAVVACDMPFASASLLVAAEGLLEQEAADVVIAETPEGFEPLHALYRRETCLPAVESAIELSQKAKDMGVAGVLLINLHNPVEVAECIEYLVEDAAAVRCNKQRECLSCQAR